MKEIANDYLMDKWKRPFIFSDLTPHAPWSWPHAASCHILNLSFTVKISHPAMSRTPLREKTQKYFFSKIWSIFIGSNAVFK